MLALDPLPAKVVPYGSRGHVDRPRSRPLRTCGSSSVRRGRARGRRSGPVRADATGAFSVRLQGRRAGRASASSAAASRRPETSLAVAPAVALKVAADYSGLAGTIRPKLPGTSVQIQQADESTGGWSTLARTTASSSGRFAAPLRRHARDLPRPRRRGPRLGGSRCRRKSSSVDPRSGCCRRRCAAAGRPTPTRRASPWASIRRLAAARRRAAARVRNGGASASRRSTCSSSTRRTRAGCVASPACAGSSGSARTAPARVHADRPARRASSGTCQQVHAFDFWPDAAGAPAGEGRRSIDSGIDATHPDLAEPHPRSRGRFVGGSDRGLGGSRDVRRRRDRRRDEQRRGHRRHRASRRNCSSRRSSAPTARSRSRPRRRRSAGRRTTAPA